MLKRPLGLVILSTFLMFPTLTIAEQMDSTSSNLEYIGYWQNFRNTATEPLRLSEIPDGFSAVVIAFASVNPFGNVKFTLQGPPYKTMADGVSLFKSDIKTLQNRGVKVLVSLGGLNSLLHLDTSKKTEDFVNSLEKIITEFGFNGIDYDFEGNMNKATRGNLFEATKRIQNDFSKQGISLTFTLAPEAIDVNWQVSEGKYDQLINSSLIDFVSVQLYNSTCRRSLKQGSPCFKPGTEDFIVSQADSTIQTWEKRGVTDAASKYIIGLPGAKRAANNGYTDPTVVNKAISCLRTGTDCASYKPTKTYPDIGGIMIWSINWDAKNDYEFFDNIGES